MNSRLGLAVVAGASLVLAAIASPVFAASARGPAVFSIATQTDNNETDPGVAALPNGSAIATWISYNDGPVGVVKECTIPRGAKSCAPKSLGQFSTPADPQTTSGSQSIVLSGGAGEIIILGGVGSTYEYASSDNGAEWAGPFVISTAFGAQAAALTDGGSDVLIAGDGDTNVGQVHFVEVPLAPNAESIATLPVVESTAAADSFTIGSYKGTSVIAAASQGSIAWYEQTGTFANDSSDWSTHTIANATTPGLASTTKGLVMGATSLGQTFNVAEAFTFNGSSFGKPTVVQRVAGGGPSNVQVAAAGATVNGVPRYTLSWYNVAGSGPKIADFAASSKNGTHWVTKRIASSSGDLHSEVASISPDGAGLVVQDNVTTWRAVRLYVGTSLSVKPAKVEEKKNHKVAIKVTLTTDLGAVVKGATVRLETKSGHLVKALKTSAKGVATAKVKSASSTSFKLVYVGTTLYDPSAATVTYTVKK